MNHQEYVKKTKRLILLLLNTKRASAHVEDTMGRVAVSMPDVTNMPGTPENRAKAFNAMRFALEEIVHATEEHHTAWKDVLDFIVNEMGEPADEGE